MSSFTEYDQYDGLGLAALVARGEVSPDELLDEAIERTERLNPKLNAVVLEHFDEARAAIASGLAEGPFRGVPFLLKDLHLLLEGTVTRYGSAMFRDYRADHDSTLTARYKQAGLNIFGKTNTPEFGLMPVTEPRLYGPARNPWNLDHTPGGSSGGASAAVAAGILPMANASDGGGSIRMPASCAGLVGFKPTRGRTPMGPDRGEGWAGQSISHVVTRTLRDTAAMLDATTGPEPGNPYEPPVFDGSFLAEVGVDPGRLRIALATEKWGAGTYQPDVVAATLETAKLLESLGHTVEEAMPELDLAALGRGAGVIVTVSTALTVNMRAEALGRAATEEDVEPATLGMVERAKGISGEDYARAVLANHVASRALGRFHASYDAILMPTLASPPVAIGHFSDSANLGEKFQNYMGDTALFNQTGQPAISLPMAWNEVGLPIGVMLVTAFGNDALLLRLASQLEAAQPWFDKRPPDNV